MSLMPLGLFILHSVVPLFSILLFLALITGFAFSSVTPSVNIAVSKKVPLNQQGISMGIVQAGGEIGGALGSFVIPRIGEAYNWQPSVIVVGS